MRNLIFRCISICLLFIVLGCSSPSVNDPIDDFNESFTPLVEGMEKQYLYPDNITYRNYIFYDTVLREDGQKVFAFEVATSPNFTDKFNSNRFLKDGFLYSCSIEKNGPESNPFNEVKIAKSSPKLGDSWKIIYDTTNSHSYEYTVNKIDGFSTPAGFFKEVANLQFIDNNQLDTIYVLYAKGYGHIGTIINKDSILVNYVKIGKKELGSFVQ